MKLLEGNGTAQIQKRQHEYNHRGCVVTGIEFYHPLSAQHHSLSLLAVKGDFRFIAYFDDAQLRGDGIDKCIQTYNSVLDRKLMKLNKLTSSRLK